MTAELGLWVGYPIFHSLLAFDERASIVPNLARSWDVSGDSKTITFHLVKGAKFHDGTPFNAEAVKWNLDRVRDPAVASTRAGDLKSIESVTVVDDSTLSIRLSEAYQPQVFQLAMHLGLMVSPTAVKNMTVMLIETVTLQPSQLVPGLSV
jgi:peptide/nickel transport system substrate-binding protein